MITLRPFTTTLLLLLLFTSGTTQAEPYGFPQLLQDGGLMMQQPPPGYQVQPTAETAVFAYEYALRHPHKKLEIRYAVRPINRVEIDYQDPHGSAPDPNHLFPMLFQTLIADLSDGGRSPSRELTPADAKRSYNADWAAMAVMDISPDFAPGYRQMLLVAIHKNFAADAYMMLLFDDYQAVKPEIDELVSKGLKFRPEDSAQPAL